MGRLINLLKLIQETYKEVKTKQKINKEVDENIAHREWVKSHRDELIELTCKCADVDYIEFTDNYTSRKRIYAYPRQVCMALLHHSLGYTQEYVEGFFKKFHPAVIHSTTVVINLLNQDEEFRFRYTPALKFAKKLDSSIYRKLEIVKYFENEKES